MDNMESEEYIMNKIIHHSPFPGGNASEYIIPGGKINITSHGMGSGIYGLSQFYLSNNPPNTDERSEQYSFSMDLQYVIMTQEECDRYVSASTTIMELFDNMKQNMLPPDVEIMNISKTFVKLMHDPKDIKHEWDFDVNDVYNSLTKFWIDYKTRQDIIEMPINYILKNEGFDGVMTKPGVTCHAWNKGDVKFIPYPTYREGDSLPVCIIIGRDGVNKKIIDLREKNYALVDDIWVRKKILPKKCRLCGETGHNPFNCPKRKEYYKNLK
jgi:hypothetical protein